MMRKIAMVMFVLLAGVGDLTFAADQQKGKPADEVVGMFMQAVGGKEAVDKLESREVEAKEHHGPKRTYYWQKPNKVLLLEGKKKFGYDGSSGWMVSSKKHVSKLPKGSQLPLQMDADPTRYVYLKQLYPEVEAGAPETIDGRKMNVLVAPNNIGSTKFYFDATDHMLARIEEFGEISAYYKNVADFTDYRTVDGIKMPFRIVHSSTEPGAATQEIRIEKVTQNGPIKPGMFDRPRGGAVVLGGKR